MNCTGRRIAAQALAVLVLSAALASAQSITLTAPGNGATISGFSYSLCANISGMPSVYSVDFVVNGNRTWTTRANYLSTSACLNNWSTFNVENGPHEWVAIARNIYGTALATSATNTATVDNSQQYNGGSDSYDLQIACTPSTAENLTWAAAITLTCTVSGTARMGETYTLTTLVDGMSSNSVAGSVNATLGTPVAITLNTDRFLDGSHHVVVRVKGSVAGVGMAIWGRTVTFGQTPAVNYELRESTDLFPVLGGSAAAPVSAVMVKTDGTTFVPTMDYGSTNTGTCTVDASGNATAVASGTAQIVEMAVEISGSDLSVAVDNFSLKSAAFPTDKTSMIGWYVHVISGIGWTPGWYQVTNAVNGLSQDIQTSPSPAGSPGATGGVFKAGRVAGPTGSSWCWSQSANVIPHFGRDGAPRTAWDPINSEWFGGMWNPQLTYAASDGSIQPIYSDAFTRYSGGGHNLYEMDLETSVPSNSSGTTAEATWDAAQNTFVSTWKANIRAAKLYLHGVETSIFGSSDGMYGATRSASALTWTNSFLKYLASSWASAATATSSTEKGYGNVVGIMACDECTNNWGRYLLQGPTTFGQRGLTSIVSDGSTCTVNWTAWGFSSVHKFLIHGATTAALNNTPPNLYTWTSVDANTFTFPCTAAAGTYNSGTDPTLQIEPFAIAYYNWPGAAANDYLHYDMWNSAMAFLNAGRGANGYSHYPAFAPEPAASAGLSALPNYIGDSGVADHGYVLIAPIPNYIQGQGSLPSLMSAGNSTPIQGRNWVGQMNGTRMAPWFGQGLGVTANYGFHGYPVSVTSCIGNTVNFSTPHNITLIYPAVTRLSVSGSTSCDGNYYVLAAPTSTSLTVALAAAGVTVGANDVTGRINFADGAIYNQSTVTGSVLSTTAYSNRLSYVDAGCTINRHRGQTITFTGYTTVAFANYVAGKTFWFGTENSPQMSPCATQGVVLEIPSLSSTGGTASIIPHNYFIRGIGAAIVTPLAFGPETTFVSALEPAVIGAAGVRLYSGTVDPQIQVSGITGSSGFTASSLQNIQQFTPGTLDHAGAWLCAIYPYTFNTPDDCHDAQTFATAGLADLWMRRMVKWLFQARLSSPDLGNIYAPVDATERNGTNGGLVLGVSFTNNDLTRTVDLSRCGQPGQKIAKYVASPTGITTTSLNAGTTSDSVTLGIGGAFAYVCPATYSADMLQPSLNLSLSAVSGATDIAVKWSYNPLFIDSNPAFDCGTGTCTLPADQHLGTIYYVPVYLASDGHCLANCAINNQSVVATDGGIQQVPQL